MIVLQIKELIECRVHKEMLENLQIRRNDSHLDKESLICLMMKFQMWTIQRVAKISFELAVQDLYEIQSKDYEKQFKQRIYRRNPSLFNHSKETLLETWKLLHLAIINALKTWNIRRSQSRRLNISRSHQSSKTTLKLSLKIWKIFITLLKIIL